MNVPKLLCIDLFHTAFPALSSPASLLAVVNVFTSNSGSLNSLLLISDRPGKLSYLESWAKAHAYRPHLLRTKLPLPRFLGFQDVHSGGAL